MSATTALRKISSLKKRIWCIQGGQGAGKTYSILQILINHASSKENKEIYIASAQLSKMRDTVIKDFVKIMKSFGLFDSKNWIGGVLYRFPNGSTVKFLGLDKDDVGKGLRSDVVYINEANKTGFEAYHELTSRAEKVIVDYNPNKEFWAHTELIPNDNCDFLNLTFKDNECLGDAERNTILGYHTKGYDSDGNITNQYWANKWRVYGLGEIGRIEGAIFENWEVGEFDDTLPSIYGLDFGVKDPDALVEVAVNESIKTIYVREAIYKNGLGTSDLAKIIKTKVEPKKLIIADSQASRTILDLAKSGIRVKPVSKNPILVDIKQIQGYKIVVTEESTNVQIEFSNYVWLDKSGEIPIDKHNHLIDAFRYAVQTITRPKKKKTTMRAR